MISRPEYTTGPVGAPEGEPPVGSWLTSSRVPAARFARSKVRPPPGSRPRLTGAGAPSRSAHISKVRSSGMLSRPTAVIVARPPSPTRTRNTAPGLPCGAKAASSGSGASGLGVSTKKASTAASASDANVVLRQSAGLRHAFSKALRRGTVRRSTTFCSPVASARRCHSSGGGNRGVTAAASGLRRFCQATMLAATAGSCIASASMARASSGA